MFSEEQVDVVIDKATDIGAISGGGTALFGLFTVNEWLGLIGAVIAAVSLGVNIWHKNRMYRLERERLDMDRVSHD